MMQSATQKSANDKGHQKKVSQGSKNKSRNSGKNKGNTFKKTTSDTSGKNKRSRNRGRKHRERDNDSGFKLVLRKLPPNLTEDEYWNTIKGSIKLDEYNINMNSCYFVSGEYLNVPFREPIYSRGYIMFKDINLLKKFASNISSVKFVDNNDNSTSPVVKISPYNRAFNNSLDEQKSESKTRKKNLENTIKDDSLFKTFIQSMKLLQENKDEYQYSTVSLFRPLKKELGKLKKSNDAIQKQTEKALVELAGVEESVKKKKKNKKNKNKKNARTEGEEKKEQKEAKVKPKTKSNSKKAKNKTKKDDIKKEKNNNIVILEVAGKKELQRRKRSILKENESNNGGNHFNKLPSLMPTPTPAQKMKLLKRDGPNA